HVKETIDYDFGSYGRHGIDRNFVTREKYDDENDAVYDLKIISVQSPTGAPTEYRESTTEEDGGRTVITRVRIGDPDRTVSSTETYVIEYELRGTMRSFGDYDEFYWDAIGTGWEADISNVTITATVPGGAQDTNCYVGPPRSARECDRQSKGGSRTATFSQQSLTPGDGFTVAVKIEPGLVSDNKPHLEPDGSKLTAGELILFGLLGLLGAVVMILPPIIGYVWWRRHGQDQRYAGLAPGTVPAPGQQIAVVQHDPKMEIPVAFSPPRIPVAEAGMLIDGQV